MVTADIPAFKKAGTRLDVRWPRWATPRVCKAACLIQTPLLGADGKVYAVAQGRLSIGGVSAGADGGGGATVQKNHPTVGQIIDGALVEKEIPSKIVNDHHLELVLREPDFTSAARMAAALNEKFTEQFASRWIPPPCGCRCRTNMRARRLISFRQWKRWRSTPDVPARIVINERTGTIVATSRIHIASCAVSHGNVTISIASTLDVSQPSRLQPERPDRGDAAHRREDEGGQGRPGAVAGNADGGKGRLGA